jgi:hypothetical protein
VRCGVHIKTSKWDGVIPRKDGEMTEQQSMYTPEEEAQIEREVKDRWDDCRENAVKLIPEVFQSLKLSVYDFIRDRMTEHLDSLCTEDLERQRATLDEYQKILDVFSEYVG